MEKEQASHEQAKPNFIRLLTNHCGTLICNVTWVRSKGGELPLFFELNVENEETITENQKRVKVPLRK